MGHFDFNLLKRSLYVGILFALFILISKNIGTGSLVLLFPKYAMIGLPIFAAMMSYLISKKKKSDGNMDLLYLTLWCNSLY